MAPDVKLVPFTELSEAMQVAVAKTIKDEMEGRTGIQTNGVGEWVRVMTLGNTGLLINYTTRKMDVEPESKVVLELLVRQYLLVGMKETG